jgi:hypothetical protein
MVVIKTLNGMKAKWISILATAIAPYLFFFPFTCTAQWSTGIEYNMTFFTTGYDEVFKPGSNFNLELKYHFNKGWGIGFQAGAARFANSKEGSFGADDPKFTSVPLIFTLEYEATPKKMIRPFFAVGLGLSIHTLSYDVGNLHFSMSDTNASFTMSPQIGLRFFITKNMMSYLRGSYVLVMDEPPFITPPNLPVVIFYSSDKTIGYAGIALGFSYRFNM